MQAGPRFEGSVFPVSLERLGIINAVDAPFVPAEDRFLLMENKHSHARPSLMLPRRLEP